MKSVMKHKIMLGGHEYPIEPLKLGQLRALLDALDDLSGKSGAQVVDAAVRVISAGLARTKPEMTVDALLDLEATMDDLTAAVGVILELAGLAQGERSPATGQA